MTTRKEWEELDAMRESRHAAARDAGANESAAGEYAMGDTIRFWHPSVLAVDRKLISGIINGAIVRSSAGTYVWIPVHVHEGNENIYVNVENVVSGPQ